MVEPYINQFGHFPNSPDQCLGIIITASHNPVLFKININTAFLQS